MTKFKDLWRKGLKANLSLNTQAGEAWVHLDVALGCPPDLPLPAHLVQQGGKSRDRRRMRRVSQQKVAKSDVEEHQVDEKTETQENLRNSGNLDELKDSEVKNITIAVEAIENDKISDDDLSLEASEIEDIVTEKVNENETEVVPSENSADDDSSVEAIEAQQKVPEEVENEIVVKEEHVIPPETLVHATAVIDDSVNEFVNQGDYSALEQLILRETHLRENIINIELGKYFTRRTQNGTFQHSVDIRILVGNEKLWENARSYIWKHLGRLEWKMKNGTVVKFNRIHVKS